MLSKMRFALDTQVIRGVCSCVSLKRMACLTGCYNVKVFSITSSYSQAL